SAKATPSKSVRVIATRTTGPREPAATTVTSISRSTRRRRSTSRVTRRSKSPARRIARPDHTCQRDKPFALWIVLHFGAGGHRDFQRNGLIVVRKSLLLDPMTFDFVVVDFEISKLESYDVSGNRNRLPIIDLH